MDYLVYFLGPVVLGVIGARILRQRFTVFFLGVAAFLLAWVVMQTVSSVAAKMWHLTERSWLYIMLVSVLAGVCEETARHLVFRRCAPFRRNRNWGSSLMYAIGHHGMESVIVGLTLLLIALVVRYRPEAISDSTTLQQCRDAAALPSGLKLYHAFERLLVGLLPHTCFSGLVMLGVATSHLRWLFVAAGWHFFHDMVGMNLHRLSDHWVISKAWIAIVVLGYSYLAVRIFHALRAVQEPAADPAPSPPPSPLILPGRSGGCAPAPQPVAGQNRRP